MPINEKERKCIEDLLIKEEQNVYILHKLANSVTGKVVDIESTEEALEFVCIHITDTQSLLNKRNITKEVLFRYLHSKKVAVTADFTKGTLINKVLNYWKNTLLDDDITQQPTPSIPAAKLTQQPCSDAYEQNVPSLRATNDAAEAQYPIHLLARKFSEWFFENYNKGSLKLEDFWSDARLMLRIAANDRIDEQECIGTEAIIDTLVSCKQQFDFFFNPNLTHAGVQGRMDIHGLVLVLVCGTLHTQTNCVGVFECTFGLMRDPFAENNWKMKTTQMVLRSQGAPNVPSLCDSDTLRDAMTLPVPMGELS